MPSSSSSSGAGVKAGFVSGGGCLDGFTKLGGICVLDPLRLPALTTIAFPLLKPGAIAAKLVTHGTVVVESALVNGTKTDGRCWDPGCDEKESQTCAKAAKTALIAVAPKASPWLAVAAALYPILASKWSHPDATGWAYVVVNGQFSKPVKLDISEDNLTPQWGVRFEHVPIQRNTAVHLELRDADWDADDPMGMIDIGPDDLARAVESRKTIEVKVNDQTSDQVLVVRVHVFPEGI